MSKIDERDGEQRPLLSANEAAEPASQAGPTQPTQPTPEPTPEPTPGASRYRLIISAILVQMTSNFVAVLVDTAMSQLTEGAACKQLHPEVKDWYSDPVCKNLDVQDRLAFILGWEPPAAFIPGVILAIPYGVFIDRYGPRATMVLVAAGGLLTQSAYLVIVSYPSIFDLRWIWAFAFLGSVIGGGSVVWQAMLFTVANMMASGRNRANVFFYMSAVSTVNNIIAGPMVYWAMNIGPVFTQSLGVFFFVLEFAFSFALPPGLANGEAAAPTSDTASTTGQTIRRSYAATKDGFLGFGKLFTKDRQLGMLLVTLVFTTIGLSQAVIRKQYATLRYGWTWGEAGLMVSVTSTATLFVMLVLVPFVSRQLLKKHTVMGKDLWLSRIGIMSLALGSLFIGLARTSEQFLVALVFYMTDICYIPASSSLIADMAGVDTAERDRTGSLYAAVTLLRNIGGTLAGPILSSFLRVGMHLGGDWLGLPFFFEAGLQLIPIAILFSIRESRYRNLPSEADEEAEADDTTTTDYSTD